MACTHICVGCGTCLIGCTSCLDWYCYLCDRVGVSCCRPRRDDTGRRVRLCFPLGLCCCFIVPLAVGLILVFAFGGSRSNIVAGYALLALPGAWILLWLLFLCINRGCFWDSELHVNYAEESDNAPTADARAAAIKCEANRARCVGRPGCTNFGSSERGGMCSVCFSEHAQGVNRSVPLPLPPASKNNGDYVLMPNSR